MTTPRKPPKPVAQWRPTTDIEREAIRALQSVTFPPATSMKRFARDLSSDRITDKQAAYLWRLVYRFRRQVRPAILVAHAKKFIDSLPPPPVFQVTAAQIDAYAQSEADQRELDRQDGPELF